MTVNNEVLDDGLTDEERAALAEEEGTGTPPADDPEAQAAADAKAAEEAAKKAAEEEAAKKAAEEAAAANPDGKTTETPPDDEDQPTTGNPILVAPPPADAEAKLTDIATKKDALLTQFDDGDITARDYQKQLDSLNREERQIERDVHEAKLAEKMEQQRLQNDWTTTCNTFVEQHAVYKDNPRLYRALDAEVRELAAKPETATWSGQKFLDEAHKNLKAAFGFQEADAPAANKQPRRDLPPNLAKVPAAEVNDTDGNRFAVLDRMASSDPLGYEEALSKMSQADRDAYLSA